MVFTRFIGLRTISPLGEHSRLVYEVLRPRDEYFPIGKREMLSILNNIEHAGNRWLFGELTSEHFGGFKGKD